MVLSWAVSVGSDVSELIHVCNNTSCSHVFFFSQMDFTNNRTSMGDIPGVVAEGIVTLACTMEAVEEEEETVGGIEVITGVLLQGGAVLEVVSIVWEKCFNNPCQWPHEAYKQIINGTDKQ